MIPCWVPARLASAASASRRAARCALVLLTHTESSPPRSTPSSGGTHARFMARWLHRHVTATGRRAQVLLTDTIAQRSTRTRGRRRPLVNCQGFLTPSLSGTPDGLGVVMAWVTEDGTHEGYVGAELEGGRLAATYSAGVVEAWNARTQTFDAFPNNAVIGWVVACGDRKSTRLNSSHVAISSAVFCLKKKM